MSATLQLALDRPHFGGPFCRVVSKSSINAANLDYAHFGLPFYGLGYVTPPNAYTYWRLEPLSPSDYYVAIAEIEMRATVGGADQCSGGTATASSTWSGQVASNAFDNNTSTYWETGVTGTGHWIQYQFTYAVEVAEIVLTSQSSLGAERVRQFAVKASNNGSDWTNITTFKTGLLAVGSTERFKIGGTETYWRLNFSENQISSSSGYIQISEIQLRSSVGGADQTSGGTVSSFSVFSGGFESALAVDDSTTTDWSSANDTFPTWWWYHFTDDIDIVEHLITAADDITGYQNYAPKAWTLQYSGDGINWTTAKSVTGETSWTSGQTRTFNNVVTPARITQQPVEVLSSGAPNVRVTQQPVESLVSGDPKVRVTQHVVEVLYPTIPPNTPLDAAVVSEATITGSMAITATLAGAVFSVSTLLGAALALPSPGYILSTQAAESTITADLTVPPDFKAAVSSESSASATLSITDNIAVEGAIAAESSHSTFLTVLSPIDAAISAESTITVDQTFFGRVDLRASIGLVPGIAGSLQKGGAVLLTWQNKSKVGTPKLNVSASIVADFVISELALTNVDSSQFALSTIVVVGLNVDHPLEASVSAVQAVVADQQIPHLPALEAVLALGLDVAPTLSTILVPQVPGTPPRVGFDCGPVICWDGRRPETYTVESFLPRSSILVSELCCEELSAFVESKAVLYASSTIVADFSSTGAVLSHSSAAIAALVAADLSWIEYTYGAPIMVDPYIDVFSCFYDAVQVSEETIWFTGDNPDNRFVLFHTYDISTRSWVERIDIPGIETELFDGDLFTFQNSSSVVTFGVNGYAVIPKATPTGYVNTTYSPTSVIVGNVREQVGTSYVWVSKYYQSPAANVLERFNLTTMAFDGTSITIIPGSTPTNFTEVSESHIVLSPTDVLWIQEGAYATHIVKQSGAVKSYLHVVPLLDALSIMNPYNPVQSSWVSSLVQVDDGRVYAFGPNWLAKLDPGTMTLSGIIETPGMGDATHYPVVDWPQRKMWWVAYGDDAIPRESWEHHIYAYDLDTESIVYDQPVPGGYQQSTYHLHSYRGGVASNGDIYLTYQGGFGGGGIPEPSQEYWHVVIVPATPV